jgi:hypothetical protein
MQTNCLRNNRRILTVLLAVLLVLTAQAGAVDLTFSWIRSGDVVHDAGVSAGLAWGDYDGDGDPDLFIANWYDQQNFLYRNEGAGTFTRIIGEPFVTDTAHSSGPAWGDFDNDGDLDLFVANQRNQHNHLYRNQGNDTFVRVESGEIVSDYGDSYSAAWADYDGDGLLDLFVSNSGGQPDFLYHNDGGGSFSRVKDGQLVTESASSYGASWGDLDDDGDEDLFIATSGNEPNRLFRNNGDGSFTKLTGSPVTDSPVFSNGGAWGDFDNDGDLDLFVGNCRYFTFGVRDILYRNDDGTFTEVTDSAVAVSERTSSAASWVDVDLDADLDLLVVHYADGNTLYLNDGTGSFSEYEEGFPIGIAGFSTGHGWADYDMDGDLDLALANWENQDNSLFDTADTGRHWLRIRLLGEQSNRSGIGATVRLATGSGENLVWQRRDLVAGTSFRSQSSAEAHFGLGDNDTAAVLRVEWPSGRVDELKDVAANRVLTITEGEGVTGEWAPPPQAKPPISDLLYDVYVNDGAEAARKRYFELRRTSPDAYDYSEEGLSPAAGRLYRENHIDELVALLHLTVEAYPESIETVESLISVCGFLNRQDELKAAYVRLGELLQTTADLDEDRRRQLENEIGYQRKHGCLREAS